jgi:hypothetical protein
VKRRKLPPGGFEDFQKGISILIILFIIINCTKKINMHQKAITDNFSYLKEKKSSLKPKDKKSTSL